MFIKDPVAYVAKRIAAAWASLPKAEAERIVSRVERDGAQMEYVVAARLYREAK